jgi:uncharacterized protein (TIGR03083 family)
MPIAAYDMLDAIGGYSTGFADAARGNLDATVESCPGWSMADLVWHLTEVQWFWATIVDERLGAPPDESRRPARPPADQLLETFLDGAEHLVEVLGSADGSDAVWTWAPAQHDVAFVSRHQVQEAAVHNWDAAHARGHDLVIACAVAEDAVDEFLTFSVSSDADPADTPRPSLAGSFCLRCTDAEGSWTLSDGTAPGTVAATRGTAEGVATIQASVSELLLWLYGRVTIDTSDVDLDLLGRFRALCFTD